METVSLTGQKRDVAKKASVVRKEGLIPAVIYGGDVLEHIAVEFKDIKNLVYTPDFKLAEIEVDGTKHTCIVKSIQYHPVQDSIEHMDFLAIEEGRKVKVELPVRFKGVSPGVKNGGKLIQSMRKVKVKVDPAYLIDEVFIDISKMKLNDTVRVQDIEVDENIEFMVNTNIPVASVVTPRALKTAGTSLVDDDIEGDEEAEGGEGAGEEKAAEAEA